MVLSASYSQYRLGEGHRHSICDEHWSVRQAKHLFNFSEYTKRQGSQLDCVLS